MKTHLALAAGFACLLAARSVFPCGAPFGTGIEAKPQQDIIVAYKNGVETYVFQPTFCGTASNFGLILPVPSTLTAAPALSDQQAFTTVDNLSQPTYVTVTACYSRSNGTGGAAGGTTSGVDASTSVVASGRVGFLDWVQLKADTEQSFTDWLTANGFPYSTAASSVFSYYVQKGWYFVAFKISQGAGPDGGTGGKTCNALGPVKLSFASAVPVVPSRMASAGTSSTGIYASGFSWRIFGLTTGDQQLAFSDGAGYNRVLGYSGALTAANVPSLAGLAQEGDRLTKLTLTFSYGTMEPDVGLSLASASDYREIKYITQYVTCNDAGTDATVDATPDSSGDGRLARDAVSEPVRDASGELDVLPIPGSEAGVKLDTGVPVVADAGPSLVPDAGLKLDTGVQVVADASASPDTGPQVVPDAGAKPDAPLALASADAAGNPDVPGTPTPELAAGGSGCSMAGASTSGGFFALALLVLAGRLRRRRGS
jgi:MYXO-CTERM domain-containing protein